ncbi:MAG TPA: hypothetical protein VG013_43225 [Gemmataceae bacterium]|jgi:hypothetical protein|nr:hypothetical protein [Gemmataceae bacterium]
MAQEKVKAVRLPADLPALLARDESEAVTQLQQEICQAVDERGFQVLLGVGLG